MWRAAAPVASWSLCKINNILLMIFLLNQSVHAMHLTSIQWNHSITAGLSYSFAQKTSTIPSKAKSFVWKTVAVKPMDSGLALKRAKDNMSQCGISSGPAVPYVHGASINSEYIPQYSQWTFRHQSGCINCCYSLRIPFGEVDRCHMVWVVGGKQWAFKPTNYSPICSLLKKKY